MWWCTGVRWQDGRPGWGWRGPRGEGRVSPLAVGGPLEFAVPSGAGRRCGGVVRGGTWTACPYGAALAPQVRGGQCPACAALDRSSSVAADTRADDPRPYRVYLAYFGPGRHKVGITAAGRGSVRLLEQAALCFTFLGEGPLMTARRTEAVLGSALRIPDRVPGTAKRAPRFRLPPAPERAAELRRRYEEVTARRDLLPDSLRRLPFRAVDHVALFGLEDPGPPPSAEVTALTPGTGLTGTVTAVAGHDVYLTAAGTRLLLDARLAMGLPLTREPGAPSPAPTTPLRIPTDETQPLF